MYGQLVGHRVFFELNFSRRLLIEVSEVLEKTDVIVPFNPPWPVHLNTQFCARRYTKRCAADYRNQFSGYHFSSGNAVFTMAKFWLEHCMLDSISGVTVISQPMAEYYQALHGHEVTIESGYDGELFNIKQESMSASASPKSILKCYIRYIGTITLDRVPRKFASALHIMSGFIVAFSRKAQAKRFKQLVQGVYA
jgi:hypothetical protein